MSPGSAEMPETKKKAKPKTDSAKAAPGAPAKGKRRSAAVDDDGHESSNKALDTVLNEMTATPEKIRIEQWASVQCPYCGEDIDVHVTSEDEGQNMSQDCHVCCRPIAIHVHLEDDELQVSAYRS